MKILKYILTLAVLSVVFCCKSDHGGPSSESPVDKLNREAFGLRYKDITKSREMAFEALALIERQEPGNYSAKAEAWNHIAYSYFLTSWFDSTRYYIGKVRDIGADYPDRDIEESITYITEARLYLRECLYAEAFKIYDSTLTIFNSGFNRLKYNDFLPLKKYNHDRYHWAMSDYLIGNAVLAYYYRDTELPVILTSLDRIARDNRLHVDTTQLSVLYYTYAGAYEKEIAGDFANFRKALENVKKGLDLLENTWSRNDYYLANFYQITGSILSNRGTLRSLETADSVETRHYIEVFKCDYLAGKFGWDEEQIASGSLPLLLFEKADSIFMRYDDPYQTLASALHVGSYHLARGDTASAIPYYSRAMACDSVISLRGGYARIWTKNLYGSLLQNVADRFSVEEVRGWFDIYAAESEIIAENTKRDYDTQKGKAEAEAKADRWLFVVIITLTVCFIVMILLHYLNRQNKKLIKARSELKSQNEELDVQYKQLSFFQKKLIEQKRMELLTYVVRGISHELSQPLGSITQTLYDTFKDIDTLEKHGESISREEYRRIIENINSDLLTISRSKDAISDLVNSFRNTIRENIIDPQTEFDLSGRLDDIIKVVRPSIKSNISLEVDCPEGLVIRSYPLLFSQVITNLVSNANQHAFPDSESTGDTVRIICRIEGNTLIVKCADNGVGIPEDELDRLCQPFVSKKQANLGLGLSLVKNIVEQYMKGEIGFYSEGGLTVTVVIPNCVVRR